MALGDELLRHNRAAAFGRGHTDVNSFLAMHGIESWKPVITALILPPVPFLLLTLIGARLLLPRRGLGWLVIFFSVVLLWLSACTGVARTISQLLLPPPAALSFDRARELRAEATAKKTVAIVILGARRRAVRARVRRQQPAATPRSSACATASGSAGRRARRSPSAAARAGAQTGAATEARVAGKIAAEEFGRPIKWLESESRDTRENAARTIDLLKPAGITHIVLVTHGYHMARALRAFNEAAVGCDPDRAGADGPGARHRPAERSTGCRARAAFATRARCCASSRGGFAGA